MLHQERFEDPCASFHPARAPCAASRPQGAANFTRAADELGLTPAAVSHQIKEMEEQLGLVLFTRNSRSMQLTPAGSVLLEATAEALGLLRRATGRARQLARGETRLRLSLGARFATQWLLPGCRAFAPRIRRSN